MPSLAMIMRIRSSRTKSGRRWPASLARRASSAEGAVKLQRSSRERNGRSRRHPPNRRYRASAEAHPRARVRPAGSALQEAKADLVVSLERVMRWYKAHTDFFARLCDVAPGQQVNITDGLLRLTAGGPRQIRIDLWPTAHQFRSGHRIRLQIPSGAPPALRAQPRHRRAAGHGDIPPRGGAGHRP
ncbi:MAG: CocE/NonD family hydrolase C-terminal non-catalytic domain-containing protein [Streptosporangiaceae bacterium]